MLSSLTSREESCSCMCLAWWYGSKSCSQAILSSSPEGDGFRYLTESSSIKKTPSGASAWDSLFLCVWDQTQIPQNLHQIHWDLPHAFFPINTPHPLQFCPPPHEALELEPAGCKNSSPEFQKPPPLELGFELELEFPVRPELTLSSMLLPLLYCHVSPSFPIQQSTRTTRILRRSSSTTAPVQPPFTAARVRFDDAKDVPEITIIQRILSATPSSTRTAGTPPRTPTEPSPLSETHATVRF
jgi:hypothetical protein